MDDLHITVKNPTLQSQNKIGHNQASLSGGPSCVTGQLSSSAFQGDRREGSTTILEFVARAGWIRA